MCANTYQSISVGHLPSKRFKLQIHRLNRRKRSSEENEMVGLKQDIEIKNMKLYKENQSIIKENEILRKKAHLLHQENQVLMSQLQKKLSQSAAKTSD